jgi:hypothetical protein
MGLNGSKKRKDLLNRGGVLLIRSMSNDVMLTQSLEHDRLKYGSYDLKNFIDCREVKVVSLTERIVFITGENYFRKFLMY